MTRARLPLGLVVVGGVDINPCTHLPAPDGDDDGPCASVHRHPTPPVRGADVISKVDISASEY